MEYIYIQNQDQFNDIYGSFKESSKIGNVYHIGLDCEFICEANHKKSYDERHNWIHEDNGEVICKLQIANSKMSLVLDLCKFNKILPEKLIKILKKNVWIKTGIGISHDMELLSKNFNLGQCSGSIELLDVFNMWNIDNPSLENVAQKLGISISKVKRKDKSYDWSNPMTLEDAEYCAIDAYLSYLIGEIFLSSSKNYFTQKLNSENKKININPIIRQPIITDKNYIGSLNEYSQKNKISLPEYIDKGIIDGEFCFTCILNNISADGFGSSKKIAKTISAKNVYDIIKK